VIESFFDAGAIGGSKAERAVRDSVVAVVHDEVLRRRSDVLRSIQTVIDRIMAATTPAQSASERKG